MILNIVTNFYVIRFVQFFLIINLMLGNFKILRLDIIFIIVIFQFLFYSLFNFKDEIVLSEIATIIWWYLFMSVLNSFLNNNHIFEEFKRKLFKSFSWISIVAAIVGLVKLFLLGQGNILPFMEINLPNGKTVLLNGTSLNLDYNIYSIGLLMGVFSTVFCYRNTNKKNIKLFYSFAIFLQLFAASLSSSRRGFVLSIVVFLILIIWNKQLMNKTFKKQINNTKYQFVFLSVFIIIVCYFYIDIDSLFNSSIEMEGLSNRLKTIETINSSENDLRTIRWEYALDYFNSKDWVANFFGSGFDYLESFGNYFGDSTLDHPHNVWISSLLYGGIIGFLFTIILTFKIGIKYYNLRNSLGFFLAFYLLFTFFNFTSSNSIFSSRLFMVIILLPFLNIFKYNNQLRYE